MSNGRKPGEHGSNIPPVSGRESIAERNKENGSEREKILLLRGKLIAAQERSVIGERYFSGNFSSSKFLEDEIFLRSQIATARYRDEILSYGVVSGKTALQSSSGDKVCEVKLDPNFIPNRDAKSESETVILDAEVSRAIVLETDVNERSSGSNISMASGTSDLLTSNSQVDMDKDVFSREAGAIAVTSSHAQTTSKPIDFNEKHFFLKLKSMRDEEMLSISAKSSKLENGHEGAKTAVLDLNKQLATEAEAMKNVLKEWRSVQEQLADQAQKTKDACEKLDLLEAKTAVTVAEKEVQVKAKPDAFAFRERAALLSLKEARLREREVLRCSFGATAELETLKRQPRDLNAAAVEKGLKGVLAGDGSDLKRYLKECSQLLESKDNDIAENTATVAKLTKQLETKDGQLREAGAKMDELAEALLHAHKVSEDLRGSEGKLQREIESLRADLAQSKQQLASAGPVKNEGREAEAMRREIEQLKSQLKLKVEGATVNEGQVLLTRDSSPSPHKKAAAASLLEVIEELKTEAEKLRQNQRDAVKELEYFKTKVGRMEQKLQLADSN